MDTQAIKYKILFSGQTLENVTYEVARSNLTKLLKASEETIDRLFSGKPIVIKKDLDRAQVDKYVSTLNRAGLDVRTDPPLEDEINIEIDESELVSAEPVATASAAAAQPAPGKDNPYSTPATENLLPSVHCRQCGTKIAQTDEVCPNCGATQIIGKPRSKVTAGLLAIFLGWLGVHRFYLGQWWGVVYFLLGLLVWPITIIEGIVFLATPAEKWDAKYGNTKPLAGAVFLVIGVLVFIVIVGILAAIAIPAYVDYSARAKVHQAMPTVERTRDQVEAFILSRGAMPGSNQEAGLPEQISGKNLRSIEVQPGGILLVTFESESSNLNEKTIAWVPELTNNTVTWDCSGGDLPKQFRPHPCREGKYRAAQAPSNVKRIVGDNGMVELVVPSSWKREELSEGAIVQVGNLFSEAYLVVHHESKTDVPGFDIKGYADVILLQMSENFGNPKIQHLGNSAVNGLPAVHYRLDGRIDDLDLVYLVTIVEGNDIFYQIISWSLASRFTGNLDDFNYAINSFQERKAAAN